MKKYLLLFILCLFVGSLYAQEIANTRRARIISPEVTKDSITFRFRAEYATTVSLTGSWQNRGESAISMKRDNNLVWSVTIPTLQPDLYYYTFNVDGGLLVKEGQDFLIKPLDVITVKRDPEFADISIIHITGEVKYPGSYSLKSRSERLSDVIERAGGLTDAGFAEGARFTRALSPNERERAKQLLEMAHSADTVDINKIAIKDRYSVGIDLVQAMSKPGCDKDILLRNGDQIEIPQRNNTVRISGEVLYPNTVPYIEDKSASYYINQAGGVNSRGHRGKAFIIYANGQVSRIYKGRIKPGCEIVIPSKPEKPTDSQKIPMIMAAVSTLSTIGAIIISALRR